MVVEAAKVGGNGGVGGEEEVELGLASIMGVVG